MAKEIASLSHCFILSETIHLQCVVSRRIPKCDGGRSLCAAASRHATQAKSQWREALSRFYRSASFCQLFARRLYELLSFKSVSFFGPVSRREIQFWEPSEINVSLDGSPLIIKTSELDGGFHEHGYDVSFNFSIQLFEFQRIVMSFDDFQLNQTFQKSNKETCFLLAFFSA